MLISNALLNNSFLPIHLAGKSKGGFNRSKRVKVGANFSEVALFSFWFNSINFYLIGFGVTTNIEKVNNPNIDTIDTDKTSTDIVDLKKQMEQKWIKKTN